MNILQRLTLSLCTFTLLASYGLSSYGQNNNSGNCVIQNSNSSKSVNYLTCYSIPNSTNNDRDFRQSGMKVPLVTKINGLQSGSKKFSIVIENQSSDVNVELSWRNLAIIDDNGNYYHLDNWPVIGSGFTKLIPPNHALRINYELDSPISSDANIVTFIYSNIFAQHANSIYADPLQKLKWSSIVSKNTASLSEKDPALTSRVSNCTIRVTSPYATFSERPQHFDRVIGRLPKGRYKVIDYKLVFWVSNEMWYQISYNGKIGWIQDNPLIINKTKNCP